MATRKSKTQERATGIVMQGGAEAARAFLIQVRDGRLAGAVVAEMLDAALPGSGQYRQDFLGVLGEYLSTALEGAATDPELLGSTGAQKRRTTVKTTKHRGGLTADGKHTVDFEREGKELFLVFDGLRIAQRGQPGTRNASKWVSMLAGWKVSGAIDEVVIEHDGVQYH